MCADCPRLDVHIEYGQKQEGVGFIEVTAPGGRINLEYTDAEVIIALAGQLYEILADTAEADERGETVKLERPASPFEDL